MKIFVSYNRRDQDFTQRLVEALRGWGHDPWLDIERIPKGANWPDEIDQALADSAVVVGVLSENSMASGAVKDEWEWAIENHKPLIPVRLRACVVSHRFVRLNYIDCLGDEQAGFAQLQQALRTPTTSYKTGVLDVTPTATQAAKVGQPPRPAARQKRSNRSTLLEKVYDYWIKGVLEPAKIGDSWLDLPADSCPEMIVPEVRRELQNPDFGSLLLGSGIAISALYRRMGNELLILGAPGSGKTITLLELARDLIAKAQTDPAEPIPLVLNLASWAYQAPADLEDWLTDRLQAEYGVPPKLARQWIDNSQLTFLLDGLDEVPAAARDACVAAINAFWRRYDQIDNGIVVCSRIADYEILDNALHLNNAIVLGALSQEQITRYIAGLGTAWDALQTVITTDPVLQNMAQSPLLLNIIAVAYRDTPREQMIGLTEAAQRRQIFDRYVGRRLREDGDVPLAYPHVRTRQYLHWIAAQMIAHGQIVFQIEQLQPDWLANDAKDKNYRLNYGIILALLTAPILLLGGFLLPILPSPWFLVLFGTPAIVAITYGTARRIQIRDQIHWSWANARIGMAIGLAVGAVVGFIYSPGGMGITSHVFGPVIGLLLRTAAFAVVGGVCGALLVGLGGSNVIEQRTLPNQGIWRSLRNGVLLGGGISLILGVIFAFGLGVYGGLLVTPFIGFGFGLVYGGQVAIQHGLLRVMLTDSGVIPRNLAKFLNYGASRHLLRRVGGGYIFRHRMLMEYFADLFT